MRWFVRAESRHRVGCAAKRSACVKVAAAGVMHWFHPMAWWTPGCERKWPSPAQGNLT
jgi:hypothetical protein